MEQPEYLYPIPRYSTFHFPWSTGDQFYHLGQAMKLEQEHSEIGCSEDTYAQTKTSSFGGPFSRNQAPRGIAMQLLGDSWSIFKDLKLEDWVKHAMGMPSAAIGLFESYHNELGLSLFCFLQQFPSDIDIFWEATKVPCAT